MTLVNLLILRVVMLTLGRFKPSLIRKLLQKKCWLQARRMPLFASKTVAVGQWALVCIYWWTASSVLEARYYCWDWLWPKLQFVMSRTFQRGQYSPATATQSVRKLARGDRCSEALFLSDTPYSLISWWNGFISIAVSLIILSVIYSSLILTSFTRIS